VYLAKITGGMLIGLGLGYLNKRWVARFPRSFNQNETVNQPWECPS
jgi:hypothetical protein